MRTLVGRLGLAALAGILALGAIGVTAPPVKAAEYSFTVTVTKVWVNQQGGITIEGTLDCSDAAASAGIVGGVMANVDWDASQTAGRHRVIAASYRSGIASECNAEPHTWSTAYPFPVGGTQWVYSADGKFATGRIHVEIFAQAHPSDDVSFYAMSGFDLKAVKFR